MTRYVGLLRAVNVGGTGKLPMTTLKELCEAAGFGDVRTYIASGNVVFRSEQSEAEVRVALEDGLRAFSGKSIGVLVRTADEIADVLARNPFPEADGSKVMALITDAALPADPFEGVTGAKDECLRLGTREMFVLYPSGMAATRLRIPAASSGTARNMNTLAKLAAMAGQPA